VVVADTNVWARAYLNDDQAQAAKARKALAEARAQGGVFVPLIVLAELAWVLRGAWERERVLAAIEHMLETLGVAVESPFLVQEAIDATRQGGSGGFADHLIAQVGFANGAREAITFDTKFGKAKRVKRLK
jgi:predicted nucleic-acid-binding protein